ncbi:THUMP-like domain-containing protein [Winogradskyella aurantiaca]|uniref:THUMP-like domain-containing protein n=1 Tax=Winogradskyella aurantiaca TaxID=2219558 RepID=UPI000E1D7CCA|nr:class I SAM-dependent methyltransferase [Winogradskyella aurantiaca]
MKTEILSDEIQKFIAKHLNDDPNDLVLRGIPFDKRLHQSILDQIRSKQKAQSKLPEWFTTEGLYYPPSLNLEQTSSEVTARYKASLVSGDTLIDIAGGFGIDSHYFSKQIKSVAHCELNEDLLAMAKHNAEVLDSDIEFYAGDSIQILKDLDQQFDWIYLDPSRRSDNKRKVFLLADCTPNAKTFKGLFLKYARKVMIKTSPLLDLKKTLEDLEFVKAIHIVAVNNEVKELLWILERDYNGSVDVISLNLTKTKEQVFKFNFEELQEAYPKTAQPLSYLYEPNAAILKSGAFNLLSDKFEVSKLHEHSHIYTSEFLLEFPGRRFKIENNIPFNKKKFSKEGIKKANITTRNFPMSVHDIRKKLNIKDGGDIYLFFTTLEDGKKSILVCSKI